MDSVIIFGAKYLFVLVVLIFGLAWLQAGKKPKTELALAVVIAGILAIILEKVGGKLYYDPRPFVTHHITPLVSHAADNGFPSEHPILAVTISAVLIFYRPKLGLLSLGLALLVGISRVTAHVHSPIDIVGGIAIGLVAGYLGHYSANRLLGHSTDQADKK